MSLTLPESLASRYAESRQKAEAVFKHFKPFGTTEALAGRIPTDLGDLITGHHALRAWPVLGSPWGLPDQMVIWYPTEAVVVAMDEFEHDYRVLPKSTEKL